MGFCLSVHCFVFNFQNTKFFQIPVGVQPDEREELLAQNLDGELQYSSMTSSGKKSALAKLWHGFDSQFMKPLLTSQRPSLMETMPGFCGACAQFLTSAEQRGVAVPINDEILSTSASSMVQPPHNSMDIEIGSGVQRGRGGSLSSGD